MSDKEYVLVTEYFHPDTASTGQLMTDLAVGLRERGMDMTVYTSQPNYHSGDNEKQPRLSTHEGVEVRRIRAPQLRQTSFPRRGFNWVVFTAWMFFALLFSRAEKQRELVFVTTPPFLPLAAWAASRLRGWPYTYIVHDLYPDFAVEAGFFREGGAVDRVWSRLTSKCLRDAENVVALGPAIKERVSRVAGPGFDEEKVAIIDNWEDKDFIQPLDKEENWFSEEHNLVDQFTLVYSGNIGGNHDLETVVEAAAKLRDRDIQFLIIGEGDYKQRIVELAEKLGVKGDTARFLPYQDRDDLPYSLTSGDASIVSVEKGLEGICVSSKLYSALAAGQPILLIAGPESDEAMVVEGCGAGMRVTQGDVDGIARAVETWISNPDLVEEQGERARECFENRYTKEKSVDKYYEVLTE